MPPKAKFSKEEITEAAVNIVKSEGLQALTARALGAKLGTSSSPIFTVFQNMDEVQQEVLKSANQLYQNYLEIDMKSKKYPPYKSSGMACNGVQREHNKKLNNGLPILHKVPPKRDYGRYFCIMAEKGGTSHGGLTEKLSPFFHAKKQEVNAYGR